MSIPNAISGKMAGKYELELVFSKFDPLICFFDGLNILHTSASFTCELFLTDINLMHRRSALNYYYHNYITSIWDKLSSFQANALSDSSQRNIHKTV